MMVPIAMLSVPAGGSEFRLCSCCPFCLSKSGGVLAQGRRCCPGHVCNVGSLGNKIVASLHFSVCRHEL